MDNKENNQNTENTQNNKNGENIGKAQASEGEASNNGEKRPASLSPRDIFLFLISLVMFCAAGIAAFPFSIFAATVGAPLYAVFSHKLGNNFSLLAPILSFAISFVATQDAATALGSLLAGGMAFAISYAVSGKCERPKTSAVIGCTVALIVYIAALLLLLDMTGRMSFESLKTSFEGFFLQTRQMLLDTYGNVDFASMGLKITESEIITAVDRAIYEVKAIFPSLAVYWLLITSYISASLLVPAAKLFCAETIFGGKKYEIRLSYTAVIIYFISSMLAVFTDGVVSYGMQNFSNILSPGFMLCGVKQIGFFCTQKGLARAAVVIIEIMSVFLALMLGSFGTTLLILFGIYYTAKQRVHINIIKK